jgi:hypothetical protein
MKATKLALALAILVGIFFSANTEAAAQDSFIKPVVSVTGKIVDQDSKTPLHVDLYILDSNGDKIGRANSNALDGYFFLTGLEPGKTYSIMIVNEEYEELVFDFVVPVVEKYEEYEKDFAMVPKSNTDLQTRK